MNILKALLSVLFSLTLTSCVTTDNHVNPTHIAILMPITGPNAKIGQKLASMIELGLEDALESNIKVITYDVAEEERIPIIIKKMQVKGTQLVLGPIYSANTQNIISQLEPHNITMFTLSNNPALASKNVYVFGHAPMKQTQRMMSYMLSKGYKDYVMLLPSSKYSRELSTVVGNMLSEKGGKLVQSEFYTDKQESIEVAVKNIADVVQNINELEDAAMKPVLYISDDTSLLREVANMLKKYNLDIQTVIVGDDKIDIEYDQPIEFLFTGSIQAHEDDALAKAKTIIGTNQLNYLDLMAYDLGKITSHTLGQGLTHEQFLARLNSGQLFIGASGIIKFEGGIADRKYDIIKHNSSGYSLVEVGK